MLIQGYPKMIFNLYSNCSFRFSLNWLCVGNSNDHHAVRLFTSDAVKSWQKQQVSLVEWDKMISIRTIHVQFFLSESHMCDMMSFLY